MCCCFDPGLDQHGDGDDRSPRSQRGPPLYGRLLSPTLLRHRYDWTLLLWRRRRGRPGDEQSRQDLRRGIPKTITRPPEIGIGLKNIKDIVKEEKKTDN